MSEHGGENGDNGDKAPAPTPLDEVKARIEARQAEEARSGVVSALDDPFAVVPASEDETDPLRWKKREGNVTLEDLHEGLIAVSQYSEAAIEGGIKMAADLSKALPTIERTASQVTTVAAKHATTAAHVHQVDESVAALAKTMNAVRKDVQFVKDAVAEMQAPVRQIPAIKELLGEILARLPEPRTKRPRKKTG